MSEKRVQFNNIVQNQLPNYVRDEFPLISEFLKSYYQALEFKGAPIDLIQNIDRYIKLDETTNLQDSVVLLSDITAYDTTINVDFGSSRTGTNGFPDSYGLIQIDNEVITYTQKTDNSFTGCIRGFSGITSQKELTNQENLVFTESDREKHKASSKIINLSNLFLKEFLVKTKNQFLPLLNERSLSENLNENLFIKQSKDFYLSRGTDISFKILFRALYNRDVTVVKPREFLFTPSNSDFRVTNDLVVESVEGDPLDLDQATLFQDEFPEAGLVKAYAPITSVEKLQIFQVGTAKSFYKLRLDGGYDRDVEVQGAIRGAFGIHPKTRVIGEVGSGTTVLLVDSTVGFGTAGELSVTYNDTTTGIVSYTSKNYTQFFGCSNITGTISDGETVGINTFAYGRSFSNQNETIRVRINSVLSDFVYPSDTKNFRTGDIAQIKTLGNAKDESTFDNWFYNYSSKHLINTLSLIDSSDNSYELILNKKHFFRENDKVTVADLSGAAQAGGVVYRIGSEKSIFIKGSGSLDTSKTYSIQRNILSGDAANFPSSQQYQANIQGVFDNSENFLVASSSIPSYSGSKLNATDRSVTFSGTFLGEELTISPGAKHNFYSGDAVYYSAGITTESYIDYDGISKVREVRNQSLGSNFPDGLYYVKRLSDTSIKLAKSKNNVYNNNFVSVESSVTVSNNTLKPYVFQGKDLQSQKLVREIPKRAQHTGQLTPTEPGYTGILINGVEILNYKAPDVVYYGKIEDVEVLSSGQNFDIIDPPQLLISDSVGTGATGNIAVSGSLESIRINDPGFDYDEVPVITITGGNGSGAVAKPNMKLIDHSASFFADVASAGISTGEATSTIGFSTYHKLRNGEHVIYRTNGQAGVSGLTTDAKYFARTTDNTTITLHNNLSDVISGINTVVLTKYGEGTHSFQTVNKKSIVESISVISGGEGYENKKRSAAATSGVSTSQNCIEIRNHDYQSGEILKYTAGSTPIGGLTDGTEYYVIVLDTNKFRLTNIGLTTATKKVFYDTNQYVEFSSKGVGTHSFNYPDISVSISGQIGISSIGLETFEAELQPIFRGEITSVNLTNNGVGYGASEVLNLDRPPSVIAVSGEDAQCQAIINQGRIDEILVLNPGRQYISPPDVSIVGDGIGAVVTPILNNGVLTEVKVIESGIGYNQNTTAVNIIHPGDGEILKAKLQTWRVNLFQKYLFSLSDDDGIIETGTNEDFGMQYCHIYAPRKLRQLVYSVDGDGNQLYGKSDLEINVNTKQEAISQNHSPIIGWSYDGHPIYGPYGYSSRSGGSVTPMETGYVERATAEQRPPLTIWPSGFFINDFVYENKTSESVLDENNGRHCVTPEFPNGTYAYFATIATDEADTQSPFTNFRRPKFPYLIGENFHAKPNEFNFAKVSNQDDFKINTTNYLKNTTPYNLFDDRDVQYKYLSLPSNLNQKIEVVNAAKGGVDAVGIITGGDNYKVGDPIVFNESETGGGGVSARVSHLLGKSVDSVSVATSSIENAEIYPNGKGKCLLFANNPHQFSNADLISISGLSTTTSGIDGVHFAGISSDVFKIAGVGVATNGIGTAEFTGFITFFNLTGNLNYPNIRENDILEIGTEQVKILNVDQRLSRVRVERAINGVVGVAHTVGTAATITQRKISIPVGFKTDVDYRVNKEIYFNPVESVGLGSTGGVGIGSTIFFSNPGAGASSIVIPTKTIFIKDHGLETGDRVTYSLNGGQGIIIQDNHTAILGNNSEDFGSIGIGTRAVDGSTFFVAKIRDNLIGLATARVSLGSTGIFEGTVDSDTITTVSFLGIGTGVKHSIKTNHDVITGDVSRNTVTVSTATSHGIHIGHDIILDVNPGVTSAFNVSYDDYNRRIIIDPKSYTSTGINTDTNVITINNHGFIHGQKIIYNESVISPTEGLSNNSMYYVSIVDRNSFKLSETFENATNSIPRTIGIGSTGDGGVINPINPPLKLYKDSIVTFNLTSSTLSHEVQSTQYPSFEFNLYADSNFTNKYVGKVGNTGYDLTRTGRVGIDGTAKVTLTVNDKTPQELYYRLDPTYESGDVPAVKSEITIDNEVHEHNTLSVMDSLYNGKHKISVARPNSFGFTIAQTPEKSSYISSTSSAQITYETDCTHTEGSVTRIEVINSGKDYSSLPGITTVTTSRGTGIILEAQSNQIGKITKTRIKDIGFDFPSDKTLRPSITLPNIISIKSLKSFDFIGISSAGRGYSTAPRLLAFDGKTGQRITDVDLDYNLGDDRVTILKNTKGISNTLPTIIPINNTNGCGISTIGFNTETNQVTVELDTGFSSSDVFPVEVGDKVLIENISIGIGSTGIGYNSSDHNYKLFPVIQVDKNLGGVGATFSYSLDGLFDQSIGEFVGVFDKFNSGGRVISERHFPIFSIDLKDNEFLNGEEVKSSTSSGIVESWDRKTGTLRVSTSKNFIKGDTIEGLDSKTQGIADKVTVYDSILNTDSSSRVIKGSTTDSGFLNANMQRIQDSFYYQNFSYSLRSRIDFDTWNDVVSTTNHTAGFKKFADYQLETPSEYIEIETNSMKVGLSTELSYFSVVNDLYSIGDFNCFYDFDLASENSLNTSNSIFSDEIIFSSRILTDFFESFGNRAVEFDDFSGQFNSNPRATRFQLIDEFNVNTSRFIKYFIYFKDERFDSERQFGIVSMLQDGQIAFMNQYGRMVSVGDLADFDFKVAGTQGSLQFFPRNFAVNDYQIVSLAYHLDDNVVGLGTSIVLGNGSVDIRTNSLAIPAGAGSRTTVVSTAATTRSMKVMSLISDENGIDHQYDELNIIHDDTEVSITEFGRLVSNENSTSFTGPGFGTYFAYLDSGALKVDFIPSVGTALTCNNLKIGFGTDGISGISTDQMKHALLEGASTTISASGTPGITTVADYINEYDSAYFMVSITDTTNNTYEMREIILMDTDSNENGTGEVEVQDFGIVETDTNLPYISGLGTFGARLNGSSGGMSLTFTPEANIAVDVKVFTQALRLEDDGRDQRNFGNGLFLTNFSRYEGTENAVKKTFTLEHRSAPVFEKYFLGNDSTIVSVDANTIRIPNHFFVSGERIRYDRNGGITSSIGIGLTNIPGVGNTEFLPINTDLYAIKIGDDKIQLASSAENALKRIAVPMEIASVGVGTSHRFTATNQNSRCLLALDNLIQSPVVATSQTTGLSTNVTTVDNVIKLSGIQSYFGSDLIKMGNEIMKITAIGIGSTNSVRVKRGQLGTIIGFGATGDPITKVVGNYNITDSIVHFSEAPYGIVPIGSTTNPPDERDWEGISASSSFQGRMFMRSGAIGATTDTYHTNYIFDSVANKFDGNTSVYTLTSNGSDDISGISTGNAIILVNDILQGPGLTRDFTLGESAGITTVAFTGAASSTITDANTSGLPVGGVLLSVGSSEGFGYQPLVSAGATAKVTNVGVLTDVAIGNTGSGYRAAESYEFLVDTNEFVGIGSTEIFIPNTGSVLDLLPQLNTGTNCTIEFGRIADPYYGGTIVSSSSTFARVLQSQALSIGIPTGTQARIVVDNPPIGFVNISAASTSVGVETSIYHVGFATIINGHVSTAISVTNNSTPRFYPTKSITNVGYSSITGITTVTTSTDHGLTEGEAIQLSGIAFTCTYAPPVNVSNVGYSTVSGITTITTATAHNLLVGKGVVLTSIGMTCEYDAVNPHYYPRTTDPAYCGVPVLQVLSSTQFVVNTGPSTVPTFYKTGGTVQGAIINAPRKKNKSASGNDFASGGSSVIAVLSPTTFVVNTGTSTCAHFYNRCGKVNRPLSLFVDDPLSYTNIPLNYVGAANSGQHGTVDVVVGNGSSIIDFSINNKGIGYKEGEILTIPTGGLTGIPTTGSISDFRSFELTVQKVFTDEFTGWSIGVLQPLDDLSVLFDGVTKAFNLTLAGSQISIRAPRGSKVDVEKVLIVTVNDILQEPGKGYEFPGGSVIKFTEAPNPGDSVKIIFYKGSGDDQDVIFREIIETVKTGDTLTLGYDDVAGQSSTLQEEARTVTNVNSTDQVQTFPYFGPGNTEDETLTRRVKWCRQTEDKIINEKRVSKDRELYEPQIHPYAYIIKSVGIGSTVIYVDRARPFFNPQNENNTSVEFQKKVKFASQKVTSGAAATAVVSDTGTISSIVISDGGVGYSTATVTIGSTSHLVPHLGLTTALANPVIGVGGTIASVIINNAGTGYTNTNPPTVLISEPGYSEEENRVTDFAGDSGIIVGFGTTTTSGLTTQFVFDLHIPFTSQLRDESIVGTAVTLSGLEQGDYFIVNNSNVGSATTSIIALSPDGSTTGVGKSFVDNVYVVSRAIDVQRTIRLNSSGVGIGTTVCRRVFVNINHPKFDTSGIGTQSTSTVAGYGDYSWGKIILPERAGVNTYTSFTNNGILGITTSMRVERSVPFKFKNYIT